MPSDPIAARVEVQLAPVAGELAEVVDGDYMSPAVVLTAECLVARYATHDVPTVDVLVDHNSGLALTQGGLVSEPELVLVMIVVLVRLAGLFLVLHGYRR